MPYLVLLLGVSLERKKEAGKNEISESIVCLDFSFLNANFRLPQGNDINFKLNFLKVRFDNYAILLILHSLFRRTSYEENQRLPSHEPVYCPVTHRYSRNQNNYAFKKHITHPFTFLLSFSIHAKTVNVRGVVHDSETRLPVPGVVVRMDAIQSQHRDR